LKHLLKRYPETIEFRGRTLPTWLINGCAADATSELLLGLAALNQAQPSMDLQNMISRFAEGLALMRYGSMNQFPFGVHASCQDCWHGWGNSQTQALAESGIIISAKLEADHFYPRLLIEGWLHSIMFDDLHAIQEYERIAYGVRCVAVGLIRLYEQTGDKKYAIMAGLAASWFTGNNNASKPMYNADTGWGYDGLESDDNVNRNAGAESTIEALYSILEIEQNDLSRSWLHAANEEMIRIDKNGCDYLYRIFHINTGTSPHRAAVVMNLTQETSQVLEGEELETFLSS